MASGISGNSAVENALPDDEMELHAEDPAESAPKESEHVQDLYTKGLFDVSERSTALGDKDKACWDDSETREVVSNPTGPGR